MAEQITTLASLTVDEKGSYGIGASAVPFSRDLYTYLRITDIKDDGTLNLQDLKSVDDDKASEYLLKPNDIVFARTGASTGRNYFYDGTDGELVYAGFLIKFSIDEKKVNPKYIKYFCQSKQHKDWINCFNTGSTRGNINAQTLGKMPIPLIERKKQDALVSILSSIDEKIKKNEAINNNLEQQMQALFNEYLSSNKFYDLTTVKDVVLSANTGADAIQKAPMVDYDTGIRCIRVGDMTNNRSFHDWGFTKVTDDVFKRYQLHKDDIVVTRTASLGLNTIIPEDLPAVYNNGLIRLTVNTSNVLPLYLFRQFQTEDFSNYISCIESETSVRPNMKINYLLKYEFVLPPITKQNEIIALLTPMLNQQNNLIVENKHLEALRDTLLPKLMSGELDVSNIDL
ncbi:restriction endonuclease subunit S [Granulicatella elegans]|uniref:restriction endonuclease subunit S n=1 Tax=Granulicatella elegans TaxID=137732 RepID=UPI001D14DCCB|nr:restriction endonuclease subunit S [Granulicatella elegans]UEA32082.1 restriction endonuclease subunit S [Granulicatella elegans]